MPAPTVTAPNTIKDPGYLFWAPLGTATPAETVAASVYTVAWGAPWVWLGATTDGSELSASMSVEYVRAAEIFDPVGSSITERNASISFSLLDITMTKLKYVMNSSAALASTGTGATLSTKFTPGGISTIVRSMIGWESTAGDMRVVLFQTLNTADVTIPFRRAPDAAVLPATFSAEVPSGSSAAFEVLGSGVARA